MVQTIHYDTDTAFLNITCGGIGLRAGAVFHERFRADRGPFPQMAVHVDTDPNTAAHVEFPLTITLSPENLQAMQADPARFGPEAVAILDHYGQYLDPEDIANGSRTIRALTQLAFAFHEPMIARMLRSALHRLLKQRRIQRVIPVLISSSGGGAGSALQILFMRKFLARGFRNLLTEGLRSNLLLRPISFVAEPYALAQQNSAPHHTRILANAFAFRIESEQLERRHGSKYIYHIGFSNGSGTILSEPHEISWVLGTCLYEFQRNWSELKARFVDGPDVADIGHGYLGADLPEIRYRNHDNNGRKEDSP